MNSSFVTPLNFNLVTTITDFQEIDKVALPIVQKSAASLISS
ncbi:hypothetical protein [Streptococcus massiliensis]|nr:hypothetical protein [Streptococcus massiliensis]